RTLSRIVVVVGVPVDTADILRAPADETQVDVPPGGAHGGAEAKGAVGQPTPVRRYAGVLVVVPQGTPPVVILHIGSARADAEILAGAAGRVQASVQHPRTVREPRRIDLGRSEERRVGKQSRP